MADILCVYYSRTGKTRRTMTEVAAALEGVDVETLPLEEIIRQSLKKMVK